jgi:hypothetical protein
MVFNLAEGGLVVGGWRVWEAQAWRGQLSGRPLDKAGWWQGGQHGCLLCPCLNSAGLASLAAPQLQPLPNSLAPGIQIRFLAVLLGAAHRIMFLNAPAPPPSSA